MPKNPFTPRSPTSFASDPMLLTDCEDLVAKSLTELYDEFDLPKTLDLMDIEDLPYPTSTLSPFDPSYSIMPYDHWFPSPAQPIGSPVSSHEYFKYHRESEPKSPYMVLEDLPFE